MFNDTRYTKAASIYLIGLFTAILMTIVVKYLYVGVIFSLYQIIFYKVIFSSAILTPFNFKYFKTIKKKDIILFLKLFACTVPEVYIVNLAWIHLPINNAVIIAFLHPLIMTMLASIMLKEKIKPNLIIALFIGIIGVLIVYHSGVKTEGDYIWYLGLLFALFISGMAWIYVKKLSQIYPTSFVVYLRILCIIPFSLIFLDKIPDLSLDNSKFLLCITLGYIAERYLVAKAYSMTDVSRLQPLKFVNIIYSSILSYLILGETLTINHIYATIIVLFALFVSSVSFSKRSKIG